MFRCCIKVELNYPEVLILVYYWTSRFAPAPTNQHFLRVRKQYPISKNKPANCSIACDVVETLDHNDCIDISSDPINVFIGFKTSGDVTDEVY